MIGTWRTKRRRKPIAAAFLAAVILLVVPICLVSVSWSGTPLHPNATPPTPDQPQSTLASNAPFDEGASASEDASGGSDVQSTKALISNGEDGITPEHEADTVIVQFTEGANAEALTQALANKACVVDGAVTAEDVQKGYKALDVAEGYDVPTAMKSLGRVEGICNPQPNYIYRLDGDQSNLGAAGSDSLTGNSQSTEETGLATEQDVNDPNGRQGSAWHLSQISAYSAWDRIRGDNPGTGKSPVTVAILDTGYDLTHEDLTAGAANGIGGNVIAAYDATAAVFTKGTGIASVNSHGTHTAGLVAAIANNNKGVAGVSYNAKVLPIQVFYKDSDGYVSNSLCMKAAFDFINANQATYNIRVVSMSLGSYCTPSQLDSEDRLLMTAETTAYNKGVLAVCSAGNGAESYGGAYGHFPGDYLSHCMNVIALDEDGHRATYSNYNASSTNLVKDISAPGGSYTQGVYSTINGGYGSMSGTSMATPLVAGVAALVFTANPSLTPDNVSDILHKTARDVIYTRGNETAGEGADRYTGYGEVDASAAVEYVLTNSCFLSGKTSMLVGGSVTLSVSHPDSITGNWTWNSTDTSVATVDADGKVTGKSAGRAQITAKHGTGDNEITLSRDVVVYELGFQVRGQDGQVAIATEATVQAGDFVEVRPIQNPTEGKWSLATTDDSILSLDLTGDNYMRIWGMNKGTAYFTITSSDNTDLTAAFKITVLERPISDATIELESSSYTYNGYARKPSVELTFHKMDHMDGKVNYVYLEEGIDYTLSYQNNINAGTATVTITGKDSFTGSTSTTFKINKAPINNANIALSPSSFVYDGTWKTPSSVTVKDIGTNAGKNITGQCSIIKGSTQLGTGSVSIQANASCANFTGSTRRTFTVSIPKKSMYRLYNRWSGEHFYTANANEYNKLGSIGWTKEGVAWESPTSSNTPVYRLYNKYSGDHHYTTNKSEYNRLGSLGWTQEGIGFYSDDRKSKAVYRGFNRYVKIGTHHYTTSASELRTMVSHGWKDEGIGWYAL